MGAGVEQYPGLAGKLVVALPQQHGDRHTGQRLKAQRRVGQVECDAADTGAGLAELLDAPASPPMSAASGASAWAAKA